MSNSPVRVTGPAALVAVVPSLVGFTPTDSLVLVYLDEARTVSLTQRVDAAVSVTGDSWASDLLAPALDGLARHGQPPAAVVAIWWDAPAPSAAIVESLTAALDLAGVDVLDAIAVTGDRWRSLLCDDAECCPPEGKPIDTADPARVELIAAGAAPVTDRAVLVSEVTPDAAAPRLDPLPEDREPARDAAIVLTLDGLTDRASTNGPTAARWLHDIRVRDVVLWELTSWDADSLRRARVQACAVARGTAAPDAAPILTMCAVLAWLGGDGARANVAVDAALSADPDYSLAQLVDGGLKAGLHPDAWRDSMAGLTRAECRKAKPVPAGV